KVGNRLAIKALDGRSNAINAQVGGVGNLCHQFGLCEIRIATQVTLLEHHVAHRDRVPVGEPVVPIVTGLAELAEAADRLGRSAAVGPKAEIAPVDRDRFLRRIAWPADAAAATAVGPADPVVQAPSQPVDAQLLVAGPKTGEHEALLV